MSRSVHSSSVLPEARWIKSSRSGQQGECVEVAGNLRADVAVRDSKNPTGPAYLVNRAAWGTFITAVKRGL